MPVVLCGFEEEHVIKIHNEFSLVYRSLWPFTQRAMAHPLRRGQPHCNLQVPVLPADRRNRGCVRGRRAALGRLGTALRLRIGRHRHTIGVGPTKGATSCAKAGGAPGHQQSEDVRQVGVVEPPAAVLIDHGARTEAVVPQGGVARQLVPIDTLQRRVERCRCTRRRCGCRLWSPRRRAPAASAGSLVAAMLNSQFSGESAG